MGRKLEGSTYESRGIHYAVITVAPRKREHFPLPTCKDEDQAKARTKIVNDVVQRLRGAGQAELVPRFAKEAAERPTGKELDRLISAVNGLCCGSMVPRDVLLDCSLFREVGEMWTSGELEKKFRGQVKTRVAANEIAGHLEKHVYPVVGDIPVSKFGLQHAQMVLNSYPDSNDPGSLRNIGKFINRIMSLAEKPLGLIPSNPLPRGWIPKAGPKKARSCVYPTEDVDLMACTAVEVGLRLLWGYLHREGHRKGEVFRLVFSDFDLELGTINLDKNKTKQPRFWVLSPGVAATLRAWKRYREEVLGERITGSSLVFFGHRNRPPEKRVFHAAKTYRENLLSASVSRAALHAQGGNRKQVRAHDTRAAFVTVAVANNRGDLWISDRTGHSSLDEMATYRRNARAFVELSLGDWRPLDGLIPELRPYLPDVSKKEPTAEAQEAATPEASAPETPAVASPTVESPAAVSSAAPSRRKARRGAAEEAAPAPLPTEAAPAPLPTEAAPAPLPAEEAPGVEASEPAAAAPPVAVVEASQLPFVADVPPACEEVAAAAPGDASEEGRLAPRREVPEGIVGANVGAVRGPWLGAGFVGVGISGSLPFVMASQFPPTFGALISSSGIGP